MLLASAVKTLPIYTVEFHRIYKKKYFIFLGVVWNDRHNKGRNSVRRKKTPGAWSSQQSLIEKYDQCCSINFNCAYTFFTKIKKNHIQIMKNRVFEQQKLTVDVLWLTSNTWLPFWMILVRLPSRPSFLFSCVPEFINRSKILHWSTLQTVNFSCLASVRWSEKESLQKSFDHLIKKNIP